LTVSLAADAPDDVVGLLGLGQQHVHLPGQASGDGVDAEANVDALVAQVAGELCDGARVWATAMP